MSNHSIAASDAINRAFFESPEGQEFLAGRYNVDSEPSDDYSPSPTSLESTPENSGTETVSSYSKESHESTIPEVNTLCSEERKAIYRVRREVIKFMEGINKSPKPRPYSYADLEILLYTCHQLLDFISTEAYADLSHYAIAQICTLVARMETYAAKIAQGGGEVDALL